MLKYLYFFITKYKIVRSILIFIYKIRGRKPWSLGYIEYKWNNIESVLKNKNLIQSFREKKLPEYFGVGLDERIVEYGWIFSNINSEKAGSLLDAGSVFNFSKILDLNFLKNKQLTILTYYPERENFNYRKISYVYGDLRNMIFKDEYFNEIVCQSTMEHIDMDNSIYGYEIKNYGNMKVKSYEYLKVVDELYRVLAKNGTLLFTFPFGKFENHGFFQQFDSEMVERIKDYFIGKGDLEINFIKYFKNGWNFSVEKECNDVNSYNPHTGKGSESDSAAHSRSICCIKFIKKDDTNL
jgi:SAM-dependent methyltransferase